MIHCRNLARPNRYKHNTLQCTVNPISTCVRLSPHTLYTILEWTVSENIVGKEENAGNQHFLLFPQCFLPFKCKISSLSHI